MIPHSHSDGGAAQCERSDNVRASDNRGNSHLYSCSCCWKKVAQHRRKPAIT